MCPVCHIPLVGFELEGIELDRCIDCRGIWLDPGELEAIGEAAGVSPGGLTAALRAAAGEKHGERKCPRCRRRLKTVRIGPRESIEIDHCPRGDGLWFDHGEMETLIASFDCAENSSKNSDKESGEEGAVARFLSSLTGYRAAPIES